MLVHLCKLGLTEQGGKLLYSFEKSKISAWVTFNHNKSLTDSQEAISVVGTLSRFIVRKLVTIEFDLRLLGLLVAGCPFGAAPHAPTAAVVGHRLSPLKNGK